MFHSSELSIPSKSFEPVGVFRLCIVPFFAGPYPFSVVVFLATQIYRKEYLHLPPKMSSYLMYP